MTDDLLTLRNRIVSLERSDEKLRRELDEVAHLGVDNAFLLENNMLLRRELRGLRARFAVDQEPSEALATDDPKPRVVKISDVTLGGRQTQTSMSDKHANGDDLCPDVAIKQARVGGGVARSIANERDGCEARIELDALIDACAHMIVKRPRDAFEG